jgi:hypothetical protein
MRGQRDRADVHGAWHIELSARQCSTQFREWCAGMLAEHVAWRGCRRDGTSLLACDAHAHLHAALQSEGARAVHQCTAAAMPLPIPLTFPRMFKAGLTSQGELVRCPGLASLAVMSGPASRLWHTWYTLASAGGLSARASRVCLPLKLQQSHVHQVLHHAG